MGVVRIAFNRIGLATSDQQHPCQQNFPTTQQNNYLANLPLQRISPIRRQAYLGNLVVRGDNLHSVATVDVQLTIVVVELVLVCRFC